LIDYLMSGWLKDGGCDTPGGKNLSAFFLFEVNKALVSRSRIFQLKLLNEADLRRVLEQALTDSERGYGKLSVTVEPDAIASFWLPSFFSHHNELALPE